MTLQLPNPTALAFAASALSCVVLELYGDDSLFSIFSFNLHAADVGAAFSGIAVIAGRPSLNFRSLLRILAFIFLAVVGFTLLRGLSQGTFLAFSSFRTRAISLLFLAYVAFSRKRLTSVAEIEPWIFFFVSIMFVIFCLRLALGPTLFLSKDSLAYLQSASLELRPVSTETVLFMDFVLVYFTNKLFRGEAGPNKNLYLIVTALAAIVIVISRQRTSGAAGLLGVVMLFTSDPVFYRRFRAVLIGLVAVVCAAGVVWMLGLVPELLKLLPLTFQVSLQKTTTLAGRENVWSFALGWRFVSWDIVRKLFGPPAGEPLDIMNGFQIWKYSLHSQYVATIMNYGIVGSLAWAALVVSAVAQSVRERSSGRNNRAGLPASTALAWLTMLLIFGFSYEWRDDAGYFAAMALAGWPRMPKSRLHASPRGRRVIASSPIAASGQGGPTGHEHPSSDGHKSASPAHP